MTPQQTTEASKETPLAFRAVRGGLWVAGSSYWQIGFGFIANIYLTRILFPEAYGVFALAMFFAQLLRLQPRLGLGSAYAQHPESSGRVIGTYIQLELGAAAGTLLLGVAAYLLLPTLGYSHEVAVLSLILLSITIIESFASIGSVLLDKELRFGPASLVHSVAFPASYIFAFWLAWRDGGVWALVAQTAVYNLLVIGGIWWSVLNQTDLLQRAEWRFDRRLARRLVGFGITVGLLSFAGSIFGQVDNFFVGTFVNETALGYYDRAYRTAHWPVLLLNSLLSRTAFFTYSRLQADKIRQRRSFEMVTWLITVVGVPIALAIFVAAPDLILLLYTEKWLPSAPFLRILVVFSAMRPLWSNASQLFVGTGQPKMMVHISVAQVVTLVLLAFPLTLWFGVVGTCSAVGIALGLGLLLILRKVAAQLNYRQDLFLLTQSLAAAIAVSLYYLINQYTGLADLDLLPRVVIKMGYGASAFWLFSFVLQPHATRERIRYVWQLLRQTRGAASA